MTVEHDALDTLWYFPSKLQDLKVLNLGAGYSDSPISSKLVNAPFKSLTNVELHRPALLTLHNLPWKAGWTKNEHMDVFAFMTNVLVDEYDVILFIDVLEHFPSIQARHLLHRAIYTATKSVLVWVPLGECPQEPYDNNILQRHHSTWIESDFVEVADYEKVPIKMYTFPAFHKHFNPPVDAAWVIFK